MSRPARGALAAAWIVAWMAAPSIAAPPAAAAATPQAEDLYRQSLAAACASCHGTQGRARGDVAWGALAGMPAAVLAERLRAFKAGTRPSTVMQQLARGYSDAQIDALAAYFAAQAK